MIEDTLQLEMLAKGWMDAEALAIDTEFERRTTFYAKLALVQIYDGKNIYLIDPLKLKCPQVLRDVFESDSIVKILHSSKEDIEVLFTAWQCELNNLFDTQVAYHFLHNDVSIGYAKMVNEFCGVVVDKEQTQSDWIKRPLAEAQLKYAATDVIYLLVIYQRLVKDFGDKRFYSMFKNECEEICEASRLRITTKASYRDAKDVWLLNENDLGLFKILFDNREATAREENRTKNHIIKDQELVILCQKKPLTIAHIKANTDIHPRSIRLYGDQWLRLISEWQEGKQKAYKRVLNPRDVAQLKELSSGIESVVKSAASQLKIPVSMLMSKRICRKLSFSLLTNDIMPSNWSGWRKSLLEESVLSKTKQIVNN